MLIPWRSSAETFARGLSSHGADTGGIADVDAWRAFGVAEVEAAWRAFGEFSQVEIAGLDPDPDSDADGIIVQWGRYSWNDRRPSVTFTRQLTVVGDELWQVSLEMCFDEGPELAGIDALPRQDTGFDFAPIGPERHAALAGMRTAVERHPQLRAAWRTKPATTRLTLDRAD